MMIKKVMTPKEAINLGADFLVIGRPITEAENIGKALGEFFKHIMSKESQNFTYENNMLRYEFA